MKQLTGVVLNTKMFKTAVVEVTRHWTHPIYKKTVIRRKKYLTHCETELKPGERVIIQETKPISKRKKWRVFKKI